MTSDPFPIVCKCGETWRRDEWQELPLVGTYDAGSDGWMELRSCVCGATLSVPRETAQTG